MKAHIDRSFVREVENEFNRLYPFLKIEFEKKDGRKADSPACTAPDENILRSRARDLLLNDLKISDGMTVSALETALLQIFDYPAQIFRKSGNFWIGTRMTRDLTLKQQNDHGRELI